MPGLNEVLTIVLSSLATGGVVLGLFRRVIEKKIDLQFELASRKHTLLWEKEIAFRQAQLEKLYGPIYSMLKTHSTIYELWRAGKIPEVNLDVKKLFESNNLAIRDILVRNIHLLEGGEMPPQFIDCMTSAMLWNWYCATSEHAAFPGHIKDLPEVQWPTHFAQHIFSTTEMLKKRLDDLYAKYTLS